MFTSLSTEEHNGSMIRPNFGNEFYYLEDSFFGHGVRHLILLNDDLFLQYFDCIKLKIV